MPDSIVALVIVVFLTGLPVASRYRGLVSAKVSGYGMNAELVVDGRSFAEKVEAVPPFQSRNE